MFGDKKDPDSGVEDYEFRKDKIYCVYFGQDWDVLRFVKKVRINRSIYFCFTPAEAGFGFGKNMYLQMKVVHQIFEFDSLAEYQHHFDEWQEEERGRKFKGDYD